MKINDLFPLTEREEAINALHYATAIYTAAPVVDDLLDAVDWPRGNRRLVDPSCGDGIFLGRALARLLRERPKVREDELLDVLQGWELHPSAAQQSRARVAELFYPNLDRAAARRNLRQAGVSNVSVEIGDAALGWSGPSPYDVIVLSGSLPELPDAFLQQLKPGGRLMAFIGTAPIMQARLIIRSDDQAFNSINLFETVVPALITGERQRFVF